MDGSTEGKQPQTTPDSKLEDQIDLERFKERDFWPPGKIRNEKTTDNKRKSRLPRLRKKHMGWKSFLALETILDTVWIAACLFLLIFCVMLLLVHIDNHNKKVLNYGRAGNMSHLDILRLSFKEELREAALSDSLHWLFTVIFIICFSAICQAYERRNAAQDEAHHVALLRRYFHTVALQDFRRYRADAEYEDVTVQNWLAASQNPE